MFDNFSKGYETFYKVLVTIWVSIWTLINLAQTVALYVQLGDINRQIMSQDIFKVVISWVSIVTGVAIVAIILLIGSRISQKKQVNNLTILGFLGFVYYIFYTLLNLLISILINSNTPALVQRELLFNSVWIIPSIVLLVCHYAYITNINRYNQELNLIKV